MCVEGGRGGAGWGRGEELTRVAVLSREGWPGGGDGGGGGEGTGKRLQVEHNRTKTQGQAYRTAEGEVECMLVQGQSPSWLEHRGQWEQGPGRGGDAGLGGWVGVGAYGEGV